MMMIDYDIPGKTSDRMYVDDASEYVYSGAVFAVCPAKLSKPALGYTEKVEELTRRWTIGKPEMGFLYPAFSDRQENANEALLYAKEPETIEFFHSLFEIPDGKSPVSAETQEARLSELMTNLGLDMEETAAVASHIAESANDSVTGEIPKGKLREILERSTDADLTDFGEQYEKSIGELPLTYGAVANKKVVISTDSAEIVVPSDKAEIVEKKVIDKIAYLCIPVDGKILVNGVETKEH